MKHLSIILASLLAILALSCQSNTPTMPFDEGGPGVGDPAADLPIDGQDEGLRELTALLNGDLDLKGSVTAPVGYVDSPASVTQPATIGELALVRLRATASDATTTRTIYSDLRGPGGAYSSMTFLSNDTNQYKALYVLRNEALSMRVHNRPSYSGTLNAPAADVNYTFETKPIQDSSEPNDDENTATVTDRTQGKALGVGVTATRSFFEFDSVTKDREDWYTTTLTAGSIYRYKFTSYNPRYGTWGYTLKLYNSAGVQVGSTTTVPTGNAAGNFTTPTIPATGTYYLQLVGNPSTRSNNSNVFYSLYSITPCEVIQIGTIYFAPTDPTTQKCPGSAGSWLTEFSGAQPDGVTASWDFGGGFSPNTSTALQPEGSLVATTGNYTGSVTLTSPCGARTTKTFPYTVECSWGASFGQVTPENVSTFNPTAIAVDPFGYTWVTGTFTGSNVKITQAQQEYTLTSGSGGTAQNGFLLRLDPTGRPIQAMNIGEGSGICQPLDIKLDSDNRAWVSGFFYGTLDFAVGAGTNNLTSAGSSDAFLISNYLGSTGTALRVGGLGFDSAEALAIDIGDYIMLTGYFERTVDFDPGVATLNRTSAGSYDAYLLRLFSDGQFNDWAAFGGESSDRAYDVVVGNTIYVVGSYSGTTDLDPLAGVQARTSAGGDDAFALKLDYSTFAYQWAYTYGAGGTDRAFSVVDKADTPRIGGIFASTVDFDPSANVQSRTSYGGNDVAIVALSSTGELQWNAWVGSAGADNLTDLAFSWAQNSVIATGSFSGLANFGSAPTGTSTPAWLSDGKDGFVFSLQDANGATIAADKYGAAGDDAVTAIDIDQSPSRGNRYLAGTYQNAVDVDPATATGNVLIAFGLVDGWFTRHTQFGTYFRP